MVLFAAGHGNCGSGSGSTGAYQQVSLIVTMGYVLCSVRLCACWWRVHSVGLPAFALPHSPLHASIQLNI